MFGLQVIDAVVMAVYFLIIIAIGIFASRRIKNQEDYFLGGRRFGKLIQTFAAFGQATSSDNSVSTTVLTARNGLAGIWAMLTGIFQIPMYWITAPWYRRLRVLTLADFFSERYGSKNLAAVYAMFSAVFFMLIIGTGFVGMTKTVAAITVKPVEELTVQERAEYALSQELDVLEARDVKTFTMEERGRMEELRLQSPRREFSYINEMWLMWIAALIVVLYAAAGGLEAAFLTDTVQGIFILILSVLLLPFALLRINDVFGGEGLSGIVEATRSQIPQAMFEVWGSPLNADFTWYYLLALTIMLVTNVAVQANQLSCMGSAKDEFSARVGFCSGIFMKRACTLLWGITALFLVVLYSGQIKNPEYIWGYAVRDLLGNLNIGLVGLMVASLLAALMSTADALMITASGLLTQNVIKPLVPGLPEKRYVMIGRVCGISVVFGSVLLISNFERFVDIIKFVWEFNTVLAASFWIGMKWRRANRFGAWASIGVTAVFFLLLPALIAMVPGVRTNEYLLKTVEPRRIEQVYTARAVDVDRRAEEIARWDVAHDGPQPAPLAVGERFSKETLTAAKSIFWTQGVKTDSSGTVRGYGRLNLGLVLLDKLGVDLAKNTGAMNETFRILFRLFVPFSLIFIVSLLTPADQSERLRRFYARLRTPSLADHEEDARQVELSCQNPDRHKDNLLFPNSNWELFKWKKSDWIAQAWIIGGGASIFLILQLMSLIGK